MNFARLDTEQTIVALATPPATPDQFAMRSIVRLAGPGCFDVVCPLLRDWAPPIESTNGFTIHHALLDAGQRRPALPVTVFYFRPGRSYTGQTMLELHLPGSTPLAEQVVDELVGRGAALAEPGEFTLRAVLAGRLDLTGAEAVAGLVAARGDGQLRAAMQLADGLLVRACDELNDRLADLLAEVEAALDFADEPLEFICPQALASGIATAISQTRSLREQAGSIESVEHRPTAGLLGRPNAGKSLLLNRLTGLERALCSPLPGTTRDILSAPLGLPAGEVLLLDSAGIESITQAAHASPDALAQQSARSMARTADLLIVVLDATAPPDEQMSILQLPEVSQRPRIVVLNKIDLLAGDEARRTGFQPVSGGTGFQPVSGGTGFQPVMNSRPVGNLPDQHNRPCRDESALPVSAVTGEGLDELKQAIADRLAVSADRPGEKLMLNARHRGALAAADAALARAMNMLTDGSPPGELLAGELREAIEQIGQIGGKIITDDLLDRIFSRFCLGK